jgi:hypothetical protein
MAVGGITKPQHHSPTPSKENYEGGFRVICGDLRLNYGNKKTASPAFAGKAAGKIDGRILYVLAAGFLAAWSKIVLRTPFGTCSKVSGSME